ncbi:hypothetical protein [Kitasatospora sp. NPDC086791]|uniref:hypothetical protein n=1 Tax=Kitasatospora sp. NPDC086791 TaxID=3155178 RepID=UPI0034156263
MPGIHHQVSRRTVAPAPDELGRVGWLVLGASALVIAAIVHALSGVLTIVKELLRPASRVPSAPAHPAPPARLSINEKDGWILISALFILSGAMAHGVARITKAVRAAIHPT